ncbi:hypothetical protein BT96DRAFT_1010659 [Gymnopus androsaceus JB14]|uniref:Uncharacterized protein n=1 Tax=Gymnopus androsaceus JB14 TaxID=1447944 RepID=A0A6A4GAB6_9AGAR|nr:hypothetical protein BT96DRAFT_1010659 [Gymnopus androsaceus JB14]
MLEPADLAMHIGSFLSVQYNTITTAATNPGSNIYASSWIRPSAPYNPLDQILAIFSLVNGAQVGTISNNGTNGGSSNSTGNKQHTSIAGPIAGRVVWWSCVHRPNWAPATLHKRMSQNFVIDTFEVPQSHLTFPPSKTDPRSHAKWLPAQVTNWGSSGLTGESWPIDPPNMIATDSSAQVEWIATDDFTPDPAVEASAGG